MNAKQESFLEELFAAAKQEGIHFATTLLAKLAGHVSESVKAANSGDPVSPPTGPKP